MGPVPWTGAGWLYATPVVPEGIVDAVKRGVPAVTFARSSYACVASGASAFVTRTARSMRWERAPGNPAIVPALASSARPEGSVQSGSRLQAKGVAPVTA